MERLTGIGVSPGVAAGRAVVLTGGAQGVVRFPIPQARVEEELARLETARERSRQQLETIRTRIAQSSGSELARLFDAQLLMLDDPMLLTRAAAIVRDEHVNAEWALQKAFDDLAIVFDDLDDPYLRERKGDLADIVGRLRMNLRRGREGPADLFRGIDGPCVLVADELTPSMVAQLDWSRILGFATDSGSRTSHTAILARSLRVPAVVGLHDASARIPVGTVVVIDGVASEVVIDPGPGYVDEVARREGSRAASRRGGISGGPACTVDGLRVRIEANIELADDLELAREYGAEGIGLYRSEFLLASTAVESITEEAQFNVYRRMLERMAPHPVTVRTFDVDEDQLAGRARSEPSRWFGPSDHPRGRFGLRAVRLGLRRRELLRAQLRALLRAGRHGQLRIMFPFVSGLEELRDAKSVLREAIDELRAAGTDVPPAAVGVMIEVPSAAFTADLIAREADFFTIGTNDLIQCCLAVDRTDDRVSHLYEPLHPSILRLIRQVRRAAAGRGLPLSLCGEMASDPALLTLLVGLGLTEFSMAPASIPLARQVIAQLHAGELRRVAAHALKLTSAPEIEAYLAEALSERGATGVR